jgi:hypothetical protein
MMLMMLKTIVTLMGRAIESERCLLMLRSSRILIGTSPMPSISTTIAVDALPHNVKVISRY